MRFLSLYSGIEAASVAWKPLGWECVGVAEIDPFPCAVLAHRYPGVPNIGDVTKLDGTPYRGKIDVLVGGSPCQDLSVAGKRAGLSGDRSSLFFQFVRLIREIQPRYVVFENVPGLLSSNNGNDIQIALDCFTESGYIYDVDILDAQFFGVPQRRRRVFVVCVRLGDLLSKRTPLSDRAMGEITAQALLATWDALLEASSPAGSPSDSTSRIGASASSLRKRMSLLDGLLGGSAATRLLGYWDGTWVPSTGESSISGSTTSGPSGNQTDDSRTGTGGFLSRAMDDTNGSPNIDSSWSDTLDVLSDPESVSITSTSMVPTIESRICSFAGIALTTLRSITNSAAFSEGPASSPDSWSLASSCSMLLRGITSYARRSACDLFVPVPLRERWGDHLRQARSYQDFFERHLGDGASPGAVLPLGHGLSGNPPPGREAESNIAPSVTPGARRVSGQRSGEHHAYPTETSGCLQHKGLAASGNEAGTLVHAVAFTSKDHGQDAGNISPTLRAMQGQHPNAGGQVAIAFQERGRTGGRQTEWQDDVAYSLNAPSGGGRRQEMNIATRSAVRRLTPLEAERLQGLPDRYTDVPFRGKRAADGPRYRAIGNSIAVPVIRWIGERIAKVDAIKPQP